MEHIYLFLYGSEWEDTIVLLTKEEAIKKSKKYPDKRVEIFSKTNESEYKPTYQYYKNGELIQKI
jgi:hypothetical protein